MDSTIVISNSNSTLDSIALYYLLAILEVLLNSADMYKKPKHSS